MDLRHLRYMLKVSEERSFSKAAEKLFIAQPYLSQYILSLEKELGVKLFDRTKSPIKLTYAGELFATKAKKILALEKELVNEMQTISNKKKGRLRLGLSQFRSTYLLPKVLPTFSQIFPNVETKIFDGTSSNFEEWLLKETIDLAVLALPVKSADLEYEEILREDILVALHPDNPLCGQATTHPRSPYKILSLEQLQCESFILLTPEQRLRQIVDDLFKRAGYQPKILIETKGWEANLSLVANGMGITFSLSSVEQPYWNEKLAYFSLSHPPQTRRIVVAYRKNKDISWITREFIDLVKSLYPNRDKF